MGMYKLVIEGEEFDLSVVNKMSAGSSNSIIIYESPGSNGGYTINTGRNNRKITLAGKMTSGLIQKNNSEYGKKKQIITNYTDENNTEILQTKITTIEDAKDRGVIVELKNPIDGISVGKWRIESFTYDIPEGSATYIDFNIVLLEHRQVNVNKTVMNLIGSEVIKQMKTRASELQLTS